MSATNRVSRPVRTGGFTHEGAVADSITPLQRLRRSVNSTLLWENGYYENGKTTAQRIADLVPLVRPHEVFNIAVQARNEHHLRHVPLFLAVQMAKHPNYRRYLDELLPAIINRADELGEFLALYWKEAGKRVPLPNAAKRGLAEAFTKFDAYQLAKYNSAAEVKLRDVLFLTHPTPKDEQQAATWRALANKQLASPDTWEVQLSAGADKKSTWERLIREGNLGYLALLRNLRNMQQVGVDADLIRAALDGRDNGWRNVLPFRYIAALRHAPQFFPQLDAAFKATVENLPQFDGTTVILVDVSDSMNRNLSAQSDLTRMDAAAALAAAFPGRKRLFTFSKQLVEVPAISGLAAIDVLKSSQIHNATLLGKAMTTINQEVEYDRIIVITDEQSRDPVPDPLYGSKGYMINVASYANGVGYRNWTHIDGFSESIFRYIAADEQVD